MAPRNLRWAKQTAEKLPWPPITRFPASLILLKKSLIKWSYRPKNEKLEFSNHIYDRFSDPESKTLWRGPQAVYEVLISSGSTPGSQIRWNGGLIPEKTDDPESYISSNFNFLRTIELTHGPDSQPGGFRILSVHVLKVPCKKLVTRMRLERRISLFWLKLYCDVCLSYVQFLKIQLWMVNSYIHFCSTICFKNKHFNSTECKNRVRALCLRLHAYASIHPKCRCNTNAPLQKSSHYPFVCANIFTKLLTL